MVLKRPGATCFNRGASFYLNNTRYDFSWSAHCLNFSDLWYDVYTVGIPQFQYKIQVTLLKHATETKVNRETGEETVREYWKRISRFNLSPSTPGGRSSDGTVSATNSFIYLTSHISIMIYTAIVGVW